MSIQKEVEFTIKGSVNDDIDDRDYEILKAKLQLVCSEYSLILEEFDDR